MALTKAKKAVKIDQLTHELEGSTSAIVGTFAKLTVSQDFELRKVVRSAGGRYRVVKNKLAARASKGTRIEQALQGLKGVSSVAYTSGDPVALAKALSTWMQENAEFTFKLGIIDGQVITVEEVKQLATMPSKEQIFSKLLFLISAPAQRLVTVMNAVGRDVAVVLNQAVEQGKFAAPAAPAKPAAAEAAPVAAADAAPVTEAPKGEPVAVATPVETAPVEAAPAAEPVAVAETTATTAPEAEAAGTGEDSQAAAAATEAPTEG
ncbi:MAG: large subunit ribosomal protein [Acidobacteriaceae bacterium]|nr:large subunit ribosomal protein [Acidobacteriaceae bacterium]